MLGLTACEKGLVDDIADDGSGQVTKSLLQVLTRSVDTAGDGGVPHDSICVLRRGLPGGAVHRRRGADAGHRAHGLHIRGLCHRRRSGDGL